MIIDYNDPTKFASVLIADFPMIFHQNPDALFLHPCSTNTRLPFFQHSGSSSASFTSGSISSQDMAGEKEENTIPLEIAIQKKLAYRRKFTSSSIQTPRQVPLPSPPSSSPCFSGTKRKEELSNRHHPPLKHQQLDNLYCKICSVSCSGAFNLKQQLMGQKHKAKLQMQELEHNQKNGRGEAIKCNGVNRVKFTPLQSFMHDRRLEELLNLHF